jgi:predicted RNA-binding protein YlqC (UPF0109 family)
MLDEGATVNEVLVRSALVLEIIPSSNDSVGSLFGRRGETIESIRTLARQLGREIRLQVAISVARPVEAGRD